MRYRYIIYLPSSESDNCEIMNIQKFYPFGIRLFQECRKMYIRRKSLSRTELKNYYFNITLGMGWAFAWSKKKVEPTTETEAPLDQKLSAIDKADSLFESGHYDECYKVLLDEDRQNKEKNVEIKWRICRALYNMSKEPKYDETSKKELILQAFKIINEQLQDHTYHYAVHKWYALLLDAKSTQEGIKERLKQLENVKKHMDLAVTINPNDATTLYMLGEWCYQVSNMPWHQRKIAAVLFATPPESTYEDALEYFLRAETVQPRFYSLNLLRLGTCYLKLKKEDQAKYYLKLAASYPAKSNDDHQANKEAAELLKKIKT